MPNPTSSTVCDECATKGLSHQTLHALLDTTRTELAGARNNYRVLQLHKPLGDIRRLEQELAQMTDGYEVALKEVIHVRKELAEATVMADSLVLLSVSLAAKHIGISRQAVLKAIDERRMHALRVGAWWILREQEVTRYAEERDG